MQTQDPIKVRIIGAGFSGLTMAYALLKQADRQHISLQIEILEKTTRVGGLIQTVQKDGMSVETGANAFLWSPDLQEMCEEIGCPLIGRTSFGRKRFIYFNGKKAWPLSFSQSLKLLVLLFKFIFIRSLVKPKSRESIASWGRRVAGDFFVERLLAPGLQGIYAGDVERMSASLILKPFFSKARRKGTRKDSKNESNKESNKESKNDSNKDPRTAVESRNRNGRLSGSVTPPEGMEQFLVSMKNYLQFRGVRFHFSEEAQLNPSNRLGQGVESSIQVIATNAKEASQLLSEAGHQEEGRALAMIQMMSLARVTIGFGTKGPRKSVEGFGVLFAPRQGFESLGVLSNSEAFRGRGINFNETWIFGGATPEQSGKVNRSDQQILNMINQDRYRLLLSKDEIQQHAIIRWPIGLPHYNLELEDVLTFIEQKRLDLFTQHKILLCGNYLGQIGLSRILQANIELAEKVVKGTYS